MGIYLNPGSGRFEESLASQIYVDKTQMIEYTNLVAGTEQKYVCVSRPRRFGKSMAANMLAAYYGREDDAKELFRALKITDSNEFEKHLNQYNVIFLNVQEFLSETHDVDQMKQQLEKSVLWDLTEAYPDVRFFDRNSLIRSLMDIYQSTKIPFVFIIDEWDCIFRENQNNYEAQKNYLDFLRNLLKDKSYVKLAYMTGILPVKKYGSHSALNMFDEFSMTDPGPLAEYFGFTEQEVRDLCDKYGMDFCEMRRWYDGYRFNETQHIYSPRSVVTALLRHAFGSYWTKTETYEALKIYIEMNFRGLRDMVTELLAGESIELNTGTFTNDMTTFQSADDVLTLLIHLGYLAYDVETKHVFIPNSEVSGEFVNAVKGAGWQDVVEAVGASDALLKATWRMDEAAVADGLKKAHTETSILTYNDENALSYTMSLAYYSARIYYTIVRELPAGKGFADLVFIPRQNHPDKPAMIVELKWDKTAEGAIDQIKRQEYVEALNGFSGNILLVGVNYNKGEKIHECRIEEMEVTL